MARYLVIQLARFGDILQTKRLIRSLQARPEAEVHLVVDRSLKQLSDKVYQGALVHGIAAHGTPQGRDPASCLRDVRRSLDELDPEGFDGVYNLNFSGLNFALASLFDPGRVHGYVWQNGQHRRDGWASMAFRWTRERRVSGINLMDFWAGYAGDMVGPETVNPAPRPRGGGLGVVMSGRHARRSLAPETMARIAAALAGRLQGAAIILLGTNQDKAAARLFTRELPAALRSPVRDLTGRTGLMDLFDVVGGLDVLLTPDTGTMHLAAHLGIPVQALFLASAWCFETGPYGPGHTVWQSCVDCAPCLESGSCRAGLVCHAPYAERALVRRCASGKGAFPPGLMVLKSRLDDLGLDFQLLEGDDPYAIRRRALRKAVTRYLLGDGAAQGPDASERLYDELNWVMDDTWRSLR